jgi:biotin operon repressor
MTAFADFLRLEAKRRDLDSQRAIARWLGMSSTVTWQVLDGQREPGLDFLLAAHRATGVNLSTLVNMAYPGTLNPAELSADAALLAQQIERLPPEVRDVVRAIIRGSVERNAGEDGQKAGDG